MALYGSQDVTAQVVEQVNAKFAQLDKLIQKQEARIAALEKENSDGRRKKVRGSDVKSNDTAGVAST